MSFFFFSSRRRHTRCSRDWSSDVCSSDLLLHHSLLRIVVVLQLGLLQFALKNINFLLDISDLLVLLSEAFAPRFLAVWIFFLFGIFLFRRVFRLYSVRRRCRCRAFRLGYRGGRSGCVLYGRFLWLGRPHIIVGIDLLRLRRVLLLLFLVTRLPRGVGHGIARLLRGVLLRRTLLPRVAS